MLDLSIPTLRFPMSKYFALDTLTLIGKSPLPNTCCRSQCSLALRQGITLPLMVFQKSNLEFSRKHDSYENTIQNYINILIELQENQAKQRYLDLKVIIMGWCSKCLPPASTLTSIKKRNPQLSEQKIMHLIVPAILVVTPNPQTSVDGAAFSR